MRIRDYEPLLPHEHEAGLSKPSQSNSREYVEWSAVFVAGVAGNAVACRESVDASCAFRSLSLVDCSSNAASLPNCSSLDPLLWAV